MEIPPSGVRNSETRRRTPQIPRDHVEAGLAAMLAQELDKAPVPVALLHEESGDFFFAEFVSGARHSSLHMAVPPSWLKKPGHRAELKAAARLFRRHVRRHLLST